MKLSDVCTLGILSLWFYYKYPSHKNENLKYAKQYRSSEHVCDMNSYLEAQHENNIRYLASNSPPHPHLPLPTYGNNHAHKVETLLICNCNSILSIDGTKGRQIWRCGLMLQVTYHLTPRM